MKILLLFILTHYAVKCDDTSNYYVIEMPDEVPPRDFKKPFRVYWNVPTMQCKSKKVLFHMEKYGIIQNTDDRGERITILYDPGLFPALLKNESSGELKFRNGGVPQEGDMDLHLETFRATMEQSIPDKDFSGVGIIDFESWRPVFRQNFGVLVPYKDVSYEIEKKKHWWWMKEWIQAEAKQRFEEAARSFMQTTLSIAKQMRPSAVWGYYGFPYCFNMAGKAMAEDCSDNIRRENDDTYWLWSESTALYPSVYSSRDLSSSQLAAMIRGRVREAARVRRKASPVLPYFWFRYREGGFMSEEDLSAALKALYNSDASGFIIWGSSNDVNTVEKCMKLRSYMEKVMGPAIAKYTKKVTREDDEMPLVTEIVDSNEMFNDTVTIMANNSSTVKSNSTIENTTVVNTKFIPIDPEYPWKPSANYSEEISRYVEKELSKKGEYNETNVENNLFATFNDSLLMDIILNSLLHTKEDKNSTINRNSDNFISEDQDKTITVQNSTQFNAILDFNLPITTSKYLLATERPYVNTISTRNPLEPTKIETTKRLDLASDLTTESTEYNKKTTSEIKSPLEPVKIEMTTLSGLSSDKSTERTEYNKKINEIKLPLDPNKIEVTTLSDLSSDKTAESTANDKQTTMEIKLSSQPITFDTTTLPDLSSGITTESTEYFDESTTETKLPSDENIQSTEYFKETESITTQSDSYSQKTTPSDDYYEFNNHFTEEVDPFYNEETLFDFLAFEESTTDGTTEINTLTSTNTPILDDNTVTDSDSIFGDVKVITESEELYPSSTDSTETDVSTNSESTEHITESLYFLKKLKKENNVRREEILPSNSTNLLLTGSPETDQVVIYIS